MKPTSPNLQQNATQEVTNNQRMARALQAIEKLQGKLSDEEAAKTEPIAIVGIGCRFPGGASSPADFWRLLHEGRDAITQVPSDRWDADAYYDSDASTPGKIVTRNGGFVENLQDFDADFFGISPREAVSLDPQQRLLLEVSWEAMEHGGMVPDQWSGRPVGIFAGVSSNDYSQYLADRSETEIDAYLATGNSHSVIAGRLSYTLGFTGPSLSVDTACSSSLVAVHLACQSLRNQECEVALAGGVNRILAPEFSINFSKAHMLSPDGRCKTFDASADGFARGEGCGVVVLKRLSDALAQGDNVLALVRGSAVNQDGRSGGLTVPNGPSQQNVIRQALANANVKPEQVGYIEAHGTGTALGDPIEVGALGAVFGKSHSKNNPLKIGSVKTNIGHLEAAAGIAGLIKVVLSMQNSKLPAHLHFQQPSPHIDWDTLPIHVTQQSTAWQSGKVEQNGSSVKGPSKFTGTRFAGISSFGFSGTNAHVIVESAPDVTELKSETTESQAEFANSTHLLTLSAKTPQALRDLSGLYAEQLTNATKLDWGEFCSAAGMSRSHFSHRLAIATSNPAEAQTHLTAYANNIGSESSRVITGKALTRKPKIAFIFTGQGAQAINMGRELYSTELVFKNTVNRCAEILSAEGAAEGIDLINVLYPPSSTLLATERTHTLNQTAYTQPALFTLAYALTELWKSWGIEPDCVLGHSIGEYAAACTAGVMDWEDGLRLIAKRGQLMQSLPAGGGMIAVMAAATQIKSYIPEGVAIAAENGPSNTVLSGPQMRLNPLAATLEKQGIKTTKLKVSHGFHSPLMEPVLDAFYKTASHLTYGLPKLKMFSTVTGRKADHHDWPRYWTNHIQQPVRFWQATECLASEDCDVVVEIGPKPVLLGMAKTCLPNSQAQWLASLRPNRYESENDRHTMLSSLGQLYVKGANVAWPQAHRKPRFRFSNLPTYPFQRERYWIDVNRAHQGKAQGTDGQTLKKSSHPLVGARISLAGTQSTYFESVISATSVPFLQEHQVFGTTVLPAVGYLEMALAAAQTANSAATFSIDDVNFHQALLLNTAQTLQVVLTPKGDQQKFEIFSAHSNEEQAGEKWLLHASGLLTLLSVDSDSALSAELEKQKKQCLSEVSVSQCYKRLERQGVTYGDSFRAITQICIGENQALSLIKLPEKLSSTLTQYRLHPVLLDACLQSIAALFIDDQKATTYLPAAIAQVKLHVPSIDCDQLWSHVEVTPKDGWLSADIQLSSLEGDKLVSINGLRLQPANKERVLSAPSQKSSTDIPIEDWFYKIDWQPQPLYKPIEWAEVESIVSSLASGFSDAIAQPTAQSYLELLPQLETLSLGYISAALKESNVRMIAPKQKNFFLRLTELVSAPAAKQAELPNAQGLQKQLAESHQTATAEFTLIQRCGENLANVLRGKTDPLTLLFPDGSTDDLTQLYQSSPGALLMNQQMQLIVERLSSEASSPLRILEIGAGTGGTTAHLLPHIGESNYTFTDISPVFLAKAKERFADYPNLDYRRLDIEQDIASQGFETDSYDLVIASNVLHATADIEQTLKRVRSLLAPDSQLILLEGTQPLIWLDLIFGMTEGWWKRSGKRSGYPLLSVSQWQQQLGAAGFEASMPLAASEDADSAALPQSIIVARKPRAEKLEGQSAAHCVVLASSESELGRQFAQATGSRVIETEVLSSSLLEDLLRSDDCTNGCVKQLVYIADEAGLVASHVETHPDLRYASATPPEGIYSRQVGDVTEPTTESMSLIEQSDEKLKSLTRKSATDLLKIIQAISQKAGATPQLNIVTQGVISGKEGLLQAPIWGLSRVIDLEYPALGCRRIDLDPDESVETNVQLLSQELQTQTVQTQTAQKTLEKSVSYQRSNRCVARLASIEKSPLLSLPSTPFKLALPTKGSPDNLQIVSSTRQAPKAGEIEIRVLAAGLNFIDVLDSLALLPFERDWLGVECAGEVVAVGDGVENFAVGDKVIALAAGSFSQYVTVPVTLAIAQPRNLTAKAAATIPANFLTAYYSLQVLTQLKKGERILIHSAAGGTGMAAVKIAQQAGAEVYATASPKKWPALRAMGVSHIMNSRTLAFADEVMDKTNGEGVSVVLNSLSGEFIEKSVSVLAEDGRFLEIGKRDIWSAQQMNGVRPDVAYHVIDLMAIARDQPQQIQTILRLLKSQFEARDLSPVQHRSFLLTEAQTAFRHMQQAQHVGKIVLEIDGGMAAKQPSSTQPGQISSWEECPQGEVGPHSMPSHPRIKAYGTYLITGGAGGLGLATAEWLVTQGARHIALLSRSVAGSPAVDSWIQENAEKGVEVSRLQADVSDRSQLASALDTLNKTLPPLIGVVHAAGVLSDGVLQQLSWSQMEIVLAPKVWGAWNLHQLTLSNELDFFALYSSAASLLGSPGQGAHVAANSFLDSLAHYRQAKGLPAVSINWGPWSEIGSATGELVQRQMARQGIGAIAPDKGIEELSQILLQTSTSQLGVVPINWSKFQSQNLTTDSFFSNFAAANLKGASPHPTATLRSNTDASAADWAKQLSEMPRRRHVTFLVQALQTEVSRVLALPSHKTIEPTVSFFDMGMDSLMAVELKNQLDVRLGRTVASTVIFEHPTIRTLATHLASIASNEVSTEQTIDDPDPPSEVPSSASADSGIPPDTGPDTGLGDESSTTSDIEKELAALESLLDRA